MVDHLEGVVLRGDLLDEVGANEGDLLHDVLSYARNVGEEEEGEDTGDGTEASSGGTAKEAVLANCTIRCRLGRI